MENEMNSEKHQVNETDDIIFEHILCLLVLPYAKLNTVLLLAQ